MTAVANVNEYEVIRTPMVSRTAMSVYERVNPIEFVDKFGRIFAHTKAGGAKTVEDGQLLALACLSENTTVFRIAKRYHLMEGKLVTKSDVMLADFRKAGGKHKWIKDGDDLQTASAEFTFDDQSQVVTYTIEDAKREKLIRPGGNWEKNPGAMLRARCVTKAIRMLCPEVADGDYTEEEMDREDDVVQGTVVQSSAPSAASIVGVDQGEAGTTKRKRRTAAEIAADQAAAANGSTQGNVSATATTATESSAATATESDVIDVEATTATTATATQGATTSTAPAAQEFNPELAGSIKPETIAKIDALAGRFGTNREGLEAHLKAGNEGFAGILSLSETAGLQLAANLETQLNAAAAAAASAQAGK